MSAADVVDDVLLRMMNPETESITNLMGTRFAILEALSAAGYYVVQDGQLRWAGETWKLTEHVTNHSRGVMAATLRPLTDESPTP